MLVLGGQGTEEECRRRVSEAIQDGSALSKFADMVREQGGDANYLYHTEKFRQAEYSRDLYAEEAGYIQSMDTERCGRTAVILGAGRETKESTVDPSAGIRFYRKTGSMVKEGETIATLYSSSQDKLTEGVEYLKRAYRYGREQPPVQKNILAIVTKGGVERF